MTTPPEETERHDRDLPSLLPADHRRLRPDRRMGRPLAPCLPALRMTSAALQRQAGIAPAAILAQLRQGGEWTGPGIGARETGKM